MANEPWCDYGDLPVSQCDHCRTGKRNAPTASSQRVRNRSEGAFTIPFSAKLEGPCNGDRACAGIEPYDIIVKLADGTYAHEECLL